MRGLPLRPERLRLVGPAADFARARLLPPAGAKLDADATAYVVAVGAGDAADVTTLARALPSASSLPAETLVFVLPVAFEAPSFAGRILSVLGRGKTISRALRSSAMLVQGYTKLGAAVDPDSRADLVWGFVPSRSSATSSR